MTPLEEKLLEALRTIASNLRGKDWLHERVEDSRNRAEVAIAEAEGREPPTNGRGEWRFSNSVAHYVPWCPTCEMRTKTEAESKPKRKPKRKAKRP